MPNVSVEYVKLSGGLDMTSPALGISPGKVTALQNYEANDTGGLRRVGGYERFDGRTAPSEAVYYCAEYTGTVAVGNTVTGAVSGATGYVVATSDGKMILTKVTGTFDETDEDFSVGGLVVGAFVGLPVEDGCETSYEHAVAKNAAADVYRADITSPGSGVSTGPTRGGGKLGGVVYVFRDNAAGTACDIWKSTAAGWVKVTLFHEISFTAGTGMIIDGNTVTQLVSGATALVKRVVLESGAWGADAAGRLIITTITGTFDATHDLQVAAATQATASSLATAITILPGGKVETVNYNFGSEVTTERMWGADGKNRAFEFDGTTYVPIGTAFTTDTPLHIKAHQGHLWLSFIGSIGHSGLNRPYEWTAFVGADEIGIGYENTGFCELPGDAIGIVSEKNIFQITGHSTTDFQIERVSPSSGGLAYTVREFMGGAIMFGLQGVVKVESSDSYGNFSQATVSRAIQPLIDAMESVVVASSVHGAKNQYRIYGSNGTGICMTSGFEKTGLDWSQVFYPTQFEYPINVFNTIQCDDDTVYICDDVGMVYQVDKGSSFDGAEIEAYFRTAFNHSKSPTTIKSYRRAVMEVTPEAYTSLRIHPEFSYGDPRISQHLVQTITMQGLGGYWDIATWGEFFYDSRVVSAPSIPIRQDGTNMGVIVYTKSDIDLGHKIDGLIIHYIPRRIKR